MDAGRPPLPDPLLTGFRRFRETRYWSEHDRYQRLEQEGQRPVGLVVACSDSRAAPETVFDAGPGQLFVVRNVAGLVPAYRPDSRPQGVSAALEYAVLALGVPSIVVLGHGRCGGIAAAIDPATQLSPSDFTGAWVAGLRDMADDLSPEDWADPGRRHRRLELLSVEQSLANLLTFPWIRSREVEGSLRLHGAWFDIGLGELHVLGPGGWGPLPGT